MSHAGAITLTVRASYGAAACDATFINLGLNPLGLGLKTSSFAVSASSISVGLGWKMLCACWRLQPKPAGAQPVHTSQS